MNQKILVVDDDPGMVRTLCDIFRLRGWDSTGVHSGEEAVTEQCAHSHDVILMDIMMPGIDGVAAMKRIKQCQPDVTVVLMTAHTTDERVAEAMLAGASDVLSKPIDLGSLIERLGSGRDA